MRRLLALAAVAACTKEPSPCARQVEMLRGWIAEVVRDGPPEPVPHGLRLATVGVRQVAPAAHGPRLVMHPDELSFEGRVLATGRWTDPAPLAAELAAVRDQIEVMADAGIPWSEMATVAATAERAGLRRLVFVFHAVAHAEHPPISSIDRDVRELHREVLDHAPLVDRVLGRCPSARTLRRDDVRALTDQLAPAIEACNCAVEMPAVQRLVWTAWERDALDTIQTRRSVPIASTGRPVALSADTPWDAASVRVLDIARGGAVHFTSDR